MKFIAKKYQGKQKLSTCRGAQLWFRLELQWQQYVYMHRAHIYVGLLHHFLVKVELNFLNKLKKKKGQL